MSIFSAWPEIAPPSAESGQLPELRVEHAVWGKAHGARSDFRWIARSPGFPNDPDLPRQLNFGNEDQPVRTQLWRNLHGRCYAVSCYPSRAADAVGRGGFLEKQVFTWESAGVPAALGALLLLPRVARLTDEVWWSQCEDGSWQDQGFALALPAPDKILIQEDEVEGAITRGIEALHAVLQPADLENYFVRFLGSLRPAVLTGLTEPLPPEALAALLLPLPGLLANRLSLAGWISGHASREDLARWDAVVLPPGLTGVVEIQAQTSPAHREQASAWARKLFLVPEPMEELVPLSFHIEKTLAPVRGEIQKPEPPQRHQSSLIAGLPGRTIDLEPPPQGASPLIQELYEFARAVDRRWLDPEASSLRKKLRDAGSFNPAHALILPSWIRQLGKQCPEDVDEKQWTVKLDLLRSAAVVFYPDPSVWKAVGLPQGRRIPALFFALLFDNVKQRDNLGGLGEAPLRQIIEHSLDCIPSSWTRKVRDLIDRWHVESNRRDPDIRRLIETAKGMRAPQRAVH